MMNKKCRCEKCYEGGERHNFHPRYDQTERPRKDVMDTPHVLETRYVYDICVWCGKTVAKNVTWHVCTQCGEKS